jgi:hypothetical protein
MRISDRESGDDLMRAAEERALATCTSFFLFVVTALVLANAFVGWSGLDLLAAAALLVIHGLRLLAWLDHRWGDL